MSVVCDICERRCHIREGGHGSCGNYINENGRIREKYLHRYLLVEPTAIETVPVFNYYPGTKFLQIATTGCVFDCSGCVSTVLVKEIDPAGKALVELSPGQVVDRAVENDCAGVVFLMNDPLASFQTFTAVAKAAKEQGLMVGFSSNGYFTEESLAAVINYLDFVNIGLKGYGDEVYRQCGVHSSKPVYRTLRSLYEQGVHVEVSCIYKLSNKENILAAAREVAAIDRTIPFQVMLFFPYEDAPRGEEPSIRRAEELVREISSFLDYIYLFNSPGTDLQDTYCPKCGQAVVKREYWGPMGALVRSKRLPDEGPMFCPQCGKQIAIKGKFNYCDCDNSDGGYSYTRALEIIEGILVTLGVESHRKVVQLWEETLGGRTLQGLYRDIQETENYLSVVLDYGAKVGEQEKAERMVSYYRKKMQEVTSRLEGVTRRPRVYYCMGKPLYSVKAERFENHIVELAGGISLNRLMTDLTGRPGMKIPAARVNKLDPEVIFLSAQYAGAIDDFYLDCREAGVDVAALHQGRVYNQLAHGWEYGSPRWLLGLLHMANCLHPELFTFDMEKEADEFYRLFYGIKYNQQELNHSFSKPSTKWTWRALDTYRRI